MLIFQNIFSIGTRKVIILKNIKNVLQYMYDIKTENIIIKQQ